MKNIYVIIVFFLCGCSNFLSEYSQDMVRAKTVADFDEVLLGSVYVPSNATTTTLINRESCSWFNIMDDDISSVRSEQASGDGSWTARNKYYDLHAMTYGYYTWQQDVTEKPDGSQGFTDNTTWNDLYARINYTKVILDELDEITPDNERDELKKNRIMGETYFLRAQFFFILANLYAAPYAPETAATTLAVPLKLTPYVEHDKEKDTQFTRTTLDRVYARIIEDLQESVRCFERGEVVSYRKIYRANKEAAQLLLSRVYLYMQDWENARMAAENFLKMDVTLEPMGDFLTSPFITEDNSEVLFSQSSQHLQNVLTAEAPDFCVSSDLYRLYDAANDYRISFFQRVSSDSIALVNKFPMDSDVSHRVSDVLMLRVAEGYLNMAEACAMLGDAGANTYLNALRRMRIGGYADQNYTGDELIGQVREERRKELCFEGHRWFDLRRYSVCSQLPFRKQIVHPFHTYNDDGGYTGTRVFVLKENETNVWTFLIPETTIDFDRIPMENNERDSREPLNENDNN